LRNCAACAASSTPSATIARQADGCGADFEIFFRLADIAHKAAVKLEGVHRQQLQVAERGVAGAEIVDRQTHAQAAQGFQALDRTLRVLHQHGLGDFQFQVRALQAGALQGALYGIAQVAHQQLLRGQVDCHPYIAETVFTPERQLLACGIDHP
jgi:hypothetical protein